MEIVVMKFGGTSVRSKSLRYHVFKHIRREVSAGYKVLVVVSAMGRLGESYATDTLRKLINDRTSKQETDRLLACGEIISSIVLSDQLQEHGLNVVSLAPFQLGIKTDTNYNSASIINIDPSIIIEQFKKSDVLIAPGFVGITDYGHIATLGRGGSDVSAIALGSALRAVYIDIYSDVEGVMTSDPKYAKDTKLLKEISYDNLISLATKEPKVIQLAAVKLAKENNIDLRFRSTITEYIGTHVVNAVTDKWNSY